MAFANSSAYHAPHMRNEKSLISVVMPVYNAMPYLDDAIHSVVVQTHSDFTFWIYDDHSTDGSYECAKQWAKRDERIRVVRGDHRLGPSGSSNAAMALADTAFVARMDADDIAFPHRLSVQFQALCDHPGAAMVGSTFRLIDAGGALIRREAPARILGRSPPFAHPTIMFRKSAFEAAGGYRPDSDYFEDTDLCRRIGLQGSILVTRQPLLDMRFAGQNARLRDDRLMVLRQLNRLFHSGGDLAPTGHRISIMAFFSLANLHILALKRPRLFTLFFRHADMKNPWNTGKFIAYLALAEFSPRLTRGMGGLFSRLRERILKPRLGNAELFYWSADRMASKARNDGVAA